MESVIGMAVVTTVGSFEAALRSVKIVQLVNILVWRGIQIQNDYLIPCHQI